jgi:1-acyl-sn-glycerol-3-phosphate acyltransferase
MAPGEESQSLPLSGPPSSNLDSASRTAASASASPGLLVHRRIGSIPLSLDRPDAGALKSAQRLLDSGCILGIFPEGQHSHEGRLVDGQAGVAIITRRAGVPVVPAAVHGTFEALRGRRFYLPRRHPCSVRFGPPIDFGPARHGPVSRTERQEITRRIMAQIAVLLPVPSPEGGGG